MTQQSRRRRRLLRSVGALPGHKAQQGGLELPQQLVVEDMKEGLTYPQELQ